MDNSFIIISSLVVVFIIMIVIVKKLKDNLNEKKNKALKSMSEMYFTGDCGPGCRFQCRYGGKCPNMKKQKHGYADNTLVSKNPVLKENLPLGYGATMGGTYSGNSSCSNNVNGVMKLQRENRYGKLYPEGEQMYGYCTEGSENIFDKPYFNVIN